MPATNIKLFSSLNIKQIITVNLGVSDLERKAPQDIEIYIKLFFDTIPLACSSDDINQTINYEHIFDSNHEVCRGKEIKLIEHLGHQLFQALRAKFDNDIKIWLRVKKTKLPVDHAGPASFVCSDYDVHSNGLC